MHFLGLHPKSKIPQNIHFREPNHKSDTLPTRETPGMGLVFSREQKGRSYGVSFVFWIYSSASPLALSISDLGALWSMELSRARTTICSVLGRLTSWITRGVF